MCCINSKKEKKVDHYSDLPFPFIAQDVPNLNVKISGMGRKSKKLGKKVLWWFACFCFIL